MTTPVLFCQPTAQRTGSERVLLTLLRTLARERFEPHVLLGEEGPLLDAFRELAASVTVVRAPKLRRSAGAAVGFATSFPRVARAVRRLTGAHGLKALHVNSLMFPQALVGGHRAGLPVVTHVHEVRSTYPGPVYDAYARLAVRLSTRLVAVCEHARDHDLPAGERMRSKTLVVHNGSDLLPLPPRVLERPLRLVALMPLTARKGALDLVEALGELAGTGLDFRLALAGRTGLERSTEARVSRRLDELDISRHVELLGEVDDVRELIGAAHVLVHPSHTEAFPLVLLEALNLARPCVATDVGGVREAVVDGETGFVVPPRDPGRFAAAIRRLAADEKAYAAMAAAAFARYSSRFTAERMGRDIEEVLRSAIERERS